MSKTRNRGFADTNPHNEPSTKSERLRDRILEIGQLKISDIVVPVSHCDTDWGVANSIADSFILTGGILAPIIVRRAIKAEDTKVVMYHLVSGVNRVWACKTMGIDVINVVFIDGDEDDARLAHIAEDLFRKQLSVLQKAEDLAQFCELALLKGFFSGQVDQKGKIGRPRSGVAHLVRQFPTADGNFEAYRLKVRRAFKIAGITSKAKRAAEEAGLDNNQDALLAIAKASGAASQVKMVEKLAADRSSLKSNASQATVMSRSSGKSANQLELHATGAQGDGKKSTQSRPFEIPPPITTLEQMKAVWVEHCRPLFARLTTNDRQTFLDGLQRERCKLRAELVKLLKKVFEGRKQVAARELYFYMDDHGFRERYVKRALRELGYVLKAKKRENGPRFYLNADKTVPQRGRVRSISDEELKKASDADRKLEDEWRFKAPRNEQNHKYYNS